MGGTRYQTRLDGKKRRVDEVKILTTCLSTAVVLGGVSLKSGLWSKYGVRAYQSEFCAVNSRYDPNY